MAIETIYIAGPMSGLPNNNHGAFFEMERCLKLINPRFKIINPARNNIGDTKGMKDSQVRNAYMDISRDQVKQSDAVVILEGWNKSVGASEEVWIAIGRDIPVRTFMDIVKMEANK